MLDGTNNNDIMESPLPLAPVVGRRRTRATAQLDLIARREQFKRRRERAAALEQFARSNNNSNISSNSRAADGTENVNTNVSTPPRGNRMSTADTSNATHATLSVAATGMGSPTAKVVIGASFGEKLPAGSIIERTPTRKELQSPPQIRRMKPAPQAVVPTPEKAVQASVGVEKVEPAATVTAATATTSDDLSAAQAALAAPVDSASAASDAATELTAAGDKEAPALKPKRVAARGIAQSGSSLSTRKRMISFSPERDERPENRALALRKLEKNLKATVKLQQRLDGVGVLRRNEEPRSAHATPSKDLAARPVYALLSPPPPPTPVTPVTHALTTPVKRAAMTPVRFETPSAPTNQTLELLSGDEASGDAAAAAASQLTASGGAVDGGDVVMHAPTSQDGDLRFDSQCTDIGASGGGGVAASQRDGEYGDGDDVCATQVLLSQVSEVESAPPMSCSQEPSNQQQQQRVAGALDFGSASSSSAAAASSIEFTSTSVIEDVGLFNCDVDVEYTGGVYGEGTDGKVSAAVISGQKVALKRAKPHDGFPEEEAKRRSAVELHYLRKVRHLQGFVQCLGLCDGIEHTCIALEVMDCKLSDYLRRYGTNTGTSANGGGTSSSTGSSSKRRYTLSLHDAKGLLRQIALPMMLLHDQVNVAHGDLACRNILLRTPPKGYERKWEPVVKLSDFGRIKLPSSEPKILDGGFSFFKNCDVGSFGREILYRFLVGEIVPPTCLETRSLHKQLQDLVVTQIPETAKERLGPYYRLFMRCTGWGVRPSFREIYDHLDDLEYFETTENGLFPLKPSGSVSNTGSLHASAPSADASFLSPVMDTASRAKFTSSGGSKGKFETPNGSLQRTSNGAPRLLQSKSGTDGSVPAVTTAAAGNKTVNLLKPRSVLRGTPHKMPNPSSAGGAASEKLLHPRSLATSSGFTPNGRPMLLKKTPPSAGASRRSLQILSQIQHRTADKGAK